MWQDLVLSSIDRSYLPISDLSHHTNANAPLHAVVYSLPLAFSNNPGLKNSLIIYETLSLFF